MAIFPKLVSAYKSNFNGLIKVYTQFNKYIITIDNLTQSGGLLIPIWRKGLKIAATQYKLSPTRSLILGLGGGTSAILINKLWPKTKILGIEIDPIMVKLAKKYFNLDSIKNLSIKITDAKTFNKGKYDLILVDTYQGKTYPDFAKSQSFFMHLKDMISPKGLIIFNRLNWGNNLQDINAQIKNLQKVFPKTKSHKILSNTLVYCSKSG